MKTYLSLLFFGIISISGFAHQPEISSTVLAQNEDNKWVLQISASLTAFQQEINTHFSEKPYQTPEEFREMVLEHIKNNLDMRFNGEEQIVLENGVVHLGHETKVIFEVTGIPEDLSIIEVTNTSFSDIHKSKSLMVVLSEGFDKNKFILNEDNNYSTALSVKGNALVQVEKNKASMSSVPLVLALLGLIGAGIFATRFNFSKADVK